MKSTPARYGTVAVTVHWLSAVLILILMGTGFRISSLTDTEAKAALLQLHVPLGLAILALTLFRVGWWVLVDRKSTPLLATSRSQRIPATIVHVLFYVVTLGMAASGIGMMLLSGAGEVIFGGSTASLPDFRNYLPRVPHGIGARLIVAFLVLHVFATLSCRSALRFLVGRVWHQRFSLLQFEHLMARM
ncbi:cytochrome b [Marivita sp. S0852]|uniref:cytochrome b n=1 Tax=Marivita sp. S0852 TaxID=3373893 RepID=UPI003981EEB3